MQHCIIGGDISPHICRLIVVNDCGDKLHVGNNVTKRAKNGENYA